MSKAKLTVNRLTKWFGGIRAVSECSFEVMEGTVVGLIGPNGSGKSTIFNLITRILAPDSGTVWYEGRRIDGLSTYQIARRGIGRTFQEVKIFRELPVWENLSIAAMGRRRIGWEPKATSWLHRVGLGDAADHTAGTLSVGQQRLLELAMNLVVEPSLIMLDEPLAGVHPSIREQIGEIIRELRAEGRTFLIVEHNMRFVMRFCDEIVVMVQGEKLVEGTPELVRSDPRVVDAFLGRSEG